MFLPASLKEEAGKKSQRFQYYKKMTYSFFSNGKTDNNKGSKPNI